MINRIERMTDLLMEDENSYKRKLLGATPKQLMLGIAFGIIFGFLLQKGGVAKYHILVGVLLLEDFTVVKVMLSAIVVGMLGVFALRRAGKVALHIKPTRYGANILGGLIFGVGFALLGYCPGTAAAALGQGNYDALFGIAGLLGGSYLFAEISGWVDNKINKIGDRGQVLLPDLVNLPALTFAPWFALFLVILLLGIEAAGF